MFNRVINAGLMGAALAFGLMLSGQAFADLTDISAEKAAELEAEAQATLSRFLAETQGAKEVLANAKGVLVCPKIRKGGFGVGVEGGKCVLTSGAPEPLYYGLVALKGGFIVGVESHSMILALNTDTALAKFTKDKREWEVGVDASVAVAKIGAGGDLDTTNLKKDIVSFIFGSKGLIADATWEGSRFKKLDIK
jgi:lipid-binding SYLF domain-containing protein